MNNVVFVQVINLCNYHVNIYFLQEAHRLHATLNPLLLGNSIARLLPVISMLPPLKSAVLIVMDSFLREEMMRAVKPALVWKEISA